jgi:hypothetical protein
MMINFIISHLKNVCPTHYPAFSLETVLQRFQPLSKLLVKTFGLLPAAQVNVVSVVLYFHKMLESVIFVQLKHQIGCKRGSTETIEAGHCLSFPFLS